MYVYFWCKMIWNSETSTCIYSFFDIVTNSEWKEAERNFLILCTHTCEFLLCLSISKTMPSKALQPASPKQPVRAHFRDFSATYHSFNSNAFVCAHFRRTWKIVFSANDVKEIGIWGNIYFCIHFLYLHFM